MGLDNYWASESGKYVDFNPELELTGGKFSRSGQGSFRGKVYAEFFKEVLDVDLYQDFSAGEVKEISEKLQDLEWMDTWPDQFEQPSEEEFKELKAMFKAYAEADFRLKASY